MDVLALGHHSRLYTKLEPCTVFPIRATVYICVDSFGETQMRAAKRDEMESGRRLRKLWSG
jgi:hypothetical protein